MKSIVKRFLKIKEEDEMYSFLKELDNLESKRELYEKIRQLPDKREFLAYLQARIEREDSFSQIIVLFSILVAFYSMIISAVEGAWKIISATTFSLIFAFVWWYLASSFSPVHNNRSKMIFLRELIKAEIEREKNKTNVRIKRKGRRIRR